MLFAGGKIQFDHTSFDFGNVRERKLTHIFTFTNIGTEALEIKSIRPSCKCLVSQVSKRVIGPGESGTITVDFKLASDGYNKTGFLVVTDSLETTEVIIYLAATFVDDIVPKPPVLRFEGLKEGEKAEEELELFVTVGNDNKKVLNVESIQSSSSFLEGTLVNRRMIDSTPDESTDLKSYKSIYDFKISLDKYKDVAQEQWLKVKFDNGQDIKIPVKIVPYEYIKISPQVLFYGIIRKDDIVKRTLKICSLSDDNVDVRVLSCPSQILKVIAERQNEKEVRLSFFLQGTSNLFLKDNIILEIKIGVNEPLKKEIAIWAKCLKLE